MGRSGTCEIPPGCEDDPALERSIDPFFSGTLLAQVFKIIHGVELMRSLPGRLKHIAFYAAILGLSLAFSRPAFASRCDDEVAPISVLMNLIQAGLSRNEIQPQQLEEDLVRALPTNLFRSQGRSPGRHSLAEAYGRYLRQLPPVLFEKFRDQVRAILDQQKTITAQLKDASIKTSKILGVKVDEEFKSFYTIGELIKTEWQGRPAFYTTAKTSDSPTFWTRIDPTHPDPTQHKIQFGVGYDPTIKSKMGGATFRSGDRKYFVDLEDDRIYDLESLVEVSRTQKSLGKVSHLRKLYATAIPVGETIRLISIWRKDDPNAEERGVGLFTDLDGHHDEAKKFYSGNDHGDFKDMKISMVEGHAILSTAASSPKSIPRFFDLSLPQGPKQVAQFMPTLNRVYRMNEAPIVFSVDGQWLTLMRYTESNMDRLGIFDLQSQTPVHQNLKIGSHDLSDMRRTDVFTVNGLPVAIISFRTGLVLMDLKTQKILWEIAHDQKPLNYDIFELDGMQYLVGQPELTKELVIYEVETGLVRARGKIPWDNLNQVVAFSHNGDPKLMVQEFFGGVHLVNLTINEAKP